MRVLGIDPGLIITGYGCLEQRGPGDEPALVEGGVFRLERRRPMADRLAQLYEDLDGLLVQLTPDLMAVEQLFSHYRHARTAILMAHARGVILLGARRHGIEVEQLAATAVKRAVSGNGHASKPQIQKAVAAQCRLPEIPDPPDVADAIAIALCAARRWCEVQPTDAAG